MDRITPRIFLSAALLGLPLTASAEAPENCDWAAAHTDNVIYLLEDALELAEEGHRQDRNPYTDDAVDDLDYALDRALNADVWLSIVIGNPRRSTQYYYASLVEDVLELSLEAAGDAYNFSLPFACIFGADDACEAMPDVYNARRELERALYDIGACKNLL